MELALGWVYGVEQILALDVVGVHLGVAQYLALEGLFAYALWELEDVVLVVNGDHGNLPLGVLAQIAMQVVEMVYGSGHLVAGYGGVVEQGRVKWPRFDLSSGQIVTRTVTVQIQPSLPPGLDVIQNIVWVSDDSTFGPDPIPEDNYAIDIDSVIASPDLSILVNTEETSALPGSVIVYDLICTNTGNQSATLVITGLTNRKITVTDWGRVLRREMLLGFMLGGFLGSCGLLAAWAVSPAEMNATSMWVIPFTLLCVVLCGSLVGSFLPLFFHLVIISIFGELFVSSITKP